MFDAPQISSAQVRSFLDNNEEVVIADIRDPQSYARGHIPGAIALNNSNLPNFLANADKSKQHVIVCYHGNDSQGAALFFRKQGFQKVHSMIGGMYRWLEEHSDLVER